MKNILERTPALSLGASIVPANLSGAALVLAALAAVSLSSCQSGDIASTVTAPTNSGPAGPSAGSPEQGTPSQQTPTTPESPPQTSNPPGTGTHPVTVPPTDGGQSNYPVHQNIITTYFWAGETSSGANGGISNVPSAWDDLWANHFGGVDDPNDRKGYFPAKFTPHENPFYFALPYNDYGRAGAKNVVYWGNSKSWGQNESMCKNQWIKVTAKGKVAYAQWEDVGPFLEDDGSYVFGSAAPHNKQLEKAGLDVSPAVKDYLGLGDVDSTSWQFVNAEEVPSGPWKEIITTTQVYYK